MLLGADTRLIEQIYACMLHDIWKGSLPLRVRPRPRNGCTHGMPGEVMEEMTVCPLCITIIDLMLRQTRVSGSPASD